jgi:phage/plasmid primase-like uncharacterized protein
MSFLNFAQQHGLVIRNLLADGQIHRCPTQSKPTSNNGAYFLDGSRGWAMDWATGEEPHWYQDDNAKPWTKEQKAEVARRQNEQRRERERGARTAAMLASKMLSEAELLVPRPARPWKPGRPALEAVPAHPYLFKKGFPDESGLVRDGELLIPMYDCNAYGVHPVGLQRILPDGTKLYLSGQRSKGAVFRLGSGRAREKWLVEGFATALSVRAALKALYRQDDVFVCFSAGNLQHIASQGIGTHVFADNDASETGETAAKATGLPYAMAETVGYDANDLHLACGLEAVVELVRKKK